MVIGASNNLSKPGGKLVKNLLDGGYKKPLYAVNPREEKVQGIATYNDVQQLPEVDLAILAIPPKPCLDAIKVLCEDKNTKAFIIISAGFSEGDEVGKRIEDEIVTLVKKHNACLIGPNCIGVLTANYSGVFTTPIPPMVKNGCDLISSSGAMALFTMEAGMQNGLRFSNIFSVGNAAQTSVEDVLEYLDQNYIPGESAPTKLLYMETIKNPKKLLKHASSLIEKGVKIAGIKAGSTDAGSRAAASHTGAIANSDMAVRALFRKAGIVYCSGREELIAVASIFNCKPLNGKNVAIITHAGGSAVMLTDALVKHGMEVPPIEPEAAKELLHFLHPGSSASNPIDFLATGTAEQLGIIIDYCEHKFKEIDAMVVVFGSPGLFNVANVYDVLRVKMDICSKPIYPVLPSVINAEKEIQHFIAHGNVNFPDEVLLGTALGAVYLTPSPMKELETENINQKIRAMIDDSSDGFLTADASIQLLKQVNIPVAAQKSCSTLQAALDFAEEIGYPIVSKVAGPLHKTDVNGVHLNVRTAAGLELSYNQLMQIEGAEGILVQKMHKGLELFIGVNYEPGLGHLILIGLGGIFVEVFNDVQSGLAPLRDSEIRLMLKRLKAYPLIKGFRGKEGIDEDLFVSLITQVSKLVENAPEIREIDLNPLLANANEIIAVDARISIEHTPQLASVH